MIETAEDSGAPVRSRDEVRVNDGKRLERLVLTV
jgi:hypothetical protein